ncbi:hypothetical protein [Microbulbifer hydrolyticus]|uniref:Membrane protein implicated in regulation of membrane protease activity n=1 Tax=Microbulbifer hydrolyticus TaxID=48074 RepID=A0A6P1TD98_9GAMM|nr:hypothetical protein [Microbulbifer hydrolyticus]MBB5212108.1 membrane protein implicated in regulation of membrane protease activity [Microbulbifer hydrolyticus]QHQ39781.1 hypothetical protein GTQ55_12835 [Microbulbifer hydrolyticus]
MTFFYLMLGMYTLGAILFVIAIVNAIVFYRTYYKRLSRKIDGEVADIGFILSASRFMHWGHFCLSEKRAKRFGVDAYFAELPRVARAQLIFHWSVFVFLGLLMLVTWVWLEFRGEA